MHYVVEATYYYGTNEEPEALVTRVEDFGGTDKIFSSRQSALDYAVRLRQSYYEVEVEKGERKRPTFRVVKG